MKLSRLQRFTSNPTQVFLAMALLFGLTFVYLIPPFMAPDEWMHFRRAYYISEGHLTAEKIQNGGEAAIGGWLPLRLYSTEMFAIWKIPYSAENEKRLLPMFQKTRDVPRDFNIKFSQDCVNTLYSQREPATGNEALYWTSFPITARYSPHLYLPQVSAIVMGKMLGTPMIGLMYYGRLFNLLLWTLLIYLAIKITPVYKWLFLVLVLTPTSIFQASSLSADAVTNGISMLFIACVLNIAFEDGKKNFLLAALFPLAMLISVSKGYVLLTFLFLIIPKEKIGGRKGYWGIFLSLIILTLASITVYSFFYNKFIVPFYGTSPSKQMLLIMKDPLHYFAILTNTLHALATMYVTTFVGRLGHYGPDMPLWFIFLHVLTLAYVALIDSNKNIDIGYKARIVFISIFIASILLILTILYLTWSPVGLSHVEGVIGRHFIPIAPLFFLFFYNRMPNKGGYSAQTNLAISLYSFFALSLSSIVILKNCWV